MEMYVLSFPIMKVLHAQCKKIKQCGIDNLWLGHLTCWEIGISIWTTLPHSKNLNTKQRQLEAITQKMASHVCIGPLPASQRLLTNKSSSLPANQHSETLPS